jgi:O-antigen/teichoic acid export membrane protein
MDKHLVGGIAWTAAAKWSTQLVTWSCFVICARLLTPSDFGMVGMAAAFLGVVNTFSEFGLGSAVITLRSLTDHEIAQINAASAISGTLGFLVSCALAVPLGLFFRSAQLPAVVVVMGTAFLITGFRTVPYSLLQRNLRFKRLSLIETVGAVSQSLCILSLAYLGRGYWALVWGNLIGISLVTGLNIASCPRGFARPRPRSIAHALGFSWRVLVARVSWNFYSDSDFLVAGRMLGSSALGAYSFAWNLATLPVEKVTALVTNVTPVFFAARQSDYEGLNRYLRNLTEALSLATFPATVGLGLVAPELISLVLGKSWSGVIAPLEVLAFFGCARSISALLGPLLTAMGETRIMMWNNLAAAILMPIAFYVGSRWGPVGIACGWIIGYPFVALPLYRRTFRRLGMSPRTYFGTILPAVNGCLVMIAVVTVLRWTMPPTWPLWARLATEISVGGAAYLIALLVLHADRVRSFITVYRRLRAPRREAA